MGRDPRDVSAQLNHICGSVRLAVVGGFITFVVEEGFDIVGDTSRDDEAMLGSQDKAFCPVGLGGRL